MATFEFTSPKGETYELEGPEGSTKEQAFEKFKSMKPELFQSEKPSQRQVPKVENESKGFAQSFKETFHPVKAITEEGIIPQVASYAKKKLQGQEFPREKEPKEKPVEFKESMRNLYSFAKKDPGAFVGTLANAVVADPELLFMPEFLPAKIVSGIEKVTKTGASLAKTADAATQAASFAFAQSAARQLNERGTVDMKVASQEAKNAAILAGGTRFAGESTRAALPGEKYMTSSQRQMVDKARSEGYTIPAKGLSPVGEVIDKYYKSPIGKINKEKFVKDVTEPTGTVLKEINPNTLAEVDKNLGLDIKKILQDQVVFIPDQYVNTLRNFLPYQKGRIENTLDEIESGQAITASQWHELRSQLGQRKAAAIKSNPTEALDIGNLIETWDDIAGKQLPESVKNDFNVWKQKYTAYKDIEGAVLQGEKNFKNFLLGELQPSDLMQSIKQRRPSEAKSPFEEGVRPQTKTAALGAGLDLLGEQSIAPWTWFNTLPKAALGVVAKPAQTLAYTPVGQSIMYHGMPEFGVAPKIGGYYQDTVNKRRKP